MMNPISALHLNPIWTLEALVVALVALPLLYLVIDFFVGPSVPEERISRIPRPPCDWSNDDDK